MGFIGFIRGNAARGGIAGDGGSCVRRRRYTCSRKTVSCGRDRESSMHADPVAGAACSFPHTAPVRAAVEKSAGSCGAEAPAAGAADGDGDTLRSMTGVASERMTDAKTTNEKTKVCDVFRVSSFEPTAAV